MKTVLIINSSNNPKHKVYSHFFESAIAGSQNVCKIIDMKSDLPLHEKFYQIEAEKPDWVLTFDLAGFECRNGMGDVSLNGMPCRMVHLLIDNTCYQQIRSDENFNYSMYFITSDENVLRQIQRNPTIVHTHLIPEMAKLLSKNTLNAEPYSGFLRQLWEITEMNIDFKECQL